MFLPYIYIINPFFGGNMNINYLKEEMAGKQISALVVTSNGIENQIQIPVIEGPKKFFEDCIFSNSRWNVDYTTVPLPYLRDWQLAEVMAKIIVAVRDNRTIYFPGQLLYACNREDREVGEVKAKILRYIDSWKEKYELEISVDDEQCLVVGVWEEKYKQDRSAHDFKTGVEQAVSVGKQVLFLGASFKVNAEAEQVAKEQVLWLIDFAIRATKYGVKIGVNDQEHLVINAVPRSSENVHNLGRLT